MEHTDILDDAVNSEFNALEQERLNKKFKPETQVDIDQPFYIGANVAMFFAQCTSVILGIGICIRMAEKFPQFKELIFGVFFIGLIAWEFGKRGSLNKLQTIRIKNRTKEVPLRAKPYRLAAFIFVIGSMNMGFFGAPEVIEECSTHDPLESIEELREGFFAQISEVQEEFLAGSLNDKIDKVTNGLTYQSGKKKGEVKSSAGSLLKELQKGQTEANGQKNEALIDLREDMNEAISIAEANNKQIIKEHKAWCSSFGLFAALGNILCDLVLLLLLPWCYNHLDRKRKLNDKKKELQERTKVTEKELPKETPKKKETVSQVVTEKEIGFRQHEEGSFLTENNERKVLLRMTKGKNKDKLVKKTERNIKDLISNASNPQSERTIYLKTLLKEF